VVSLDSLISKRLVVLEEDDGNKQTEKKKARKMFCSKSVYHLLAIEKDLNCHHCMTFVPMMLLIRFRKRVESKQKRKCCCFELFFCCVISVPFCKVRDRINFQTTKQTLCQIRLANNEKRNEKLLFSIAHLCFSSLFLQKNR
jgi:hypothetical protein